MTVAPSGPHRRSTDPRIDDILASQGRLLDMVTAFNKRLDGVINEMQSIREDARNFPGGRELIRRLEASETHHADQDDKIDGLESFRDELRGSIRMLQALATIATAMGALATILSTAFVLSGGRVP